MRVGKIAQTNIISVHPHDRLDKAILLMEEYHIRHLPVIDARRPVGMISDRDLLIAVGWKLSPDRGASTMPKAYNHPRQVREIMTRPALYIDADATVHTAARVMVRGHFHALPVLHGERVLGVVTSSDLLQTAVREFANTDALQTRVSVYMHCDVVTAGPRDTIHLVAGQMHDAAIRHLPVVSDGVLIGILSDRDIRRACGIDQMEDARAESEGRVYIGATEVIDILTPAPVTIDHNATARDAMIQLAKHRIGCLPVVECNRLVGLFSETDALHIIADLEHAHAQQDSSQAS